MQHNTASLTSHKTHSDEPEYLPTLILLLQHTMADITLFTYT